MHEKYVKIHSLSVSKLLYDFINKEAIPGTDINENKFWKGFDKVLNELSNKNSEENEWLNSRIQETAVYVQNNPAFDMSIQVTIPKDIFSEHFVDDTSLIDYVFSLLEVNYNIYDKNNNEKHLYVIKKQLIENGLNINKPHGIYSVIIDDCNTYLTYRIALCYLICPKKTINIV